MSTERDTNRIVRSWLRTDEHESADRVLDTVLNLLDATPQHRSWWPVRRITEMHSIAKLAIAAAAVAVVVVVGMNLRPGNSGVVGGPSAPPAAQASPTPSPTPAPTPSASPAALHTNRPEPSAVADAFPPPGDVGVGRHAFSQGGVPFSLQLSSPGWSTNGVEVPPDGGSLSKGAGGDASSAWVILWGIDGVYSHPCAGVASPPTGPSIAALADAVVEIPGLDVTRPTDVKVGGYAAKLVVVTVPDAIGCSPAAFNLWYDDVRCGDSDPCNRWVSFLGSTIRVWIVDVNGKRVWIEAETYRGATPAITDEVQRMVDSIRFE